MTHDLFDQGYGRLWTDAYVCDRSAYSTSVTDYHEHDFYEINLILSGNVKILLGDRTEEGTGSRVVLTRPKTPHYISCAPDTLYSRIYLLFTESFVADYLSEWNQLSSVFGEQGAILSVTAEETALLRGLLEQLRGENKPFRKRLLIYCFLSHLSELRGAAVETRKLPPYVVECLSYLESHCGERITAEALARELHVGRTTLMTAFKRYTGCTMGDYLTHCRLRKAIGLLREGRTLEYTAAECGFSDSSGLVRGFRRIYGMTPRRYLSENDA